MKWGFTLVELLVVIVVIAILLALLLPAINGALRTARNAAVAAEISQMAQALADFKSKYGDYPPSRILLVENGNYTTYIGNGTPVSSIDPNRTPNAGTGDITVGQLATRSLTALRKFWPKVQLSTNGTLPPNVASGNGNYWYDFNGNGIFDQAPYVLQGHECLVFFLGGIPLPNPIPTANGFPDPSTVTFGITGFGNDPTNPFTNSIIGSPMYNANRQPSFFQFNPGRLFADPTNFSMNGNPPLMPGYYDTLNSGPPNAGSGTGQWVHTIAGGQGPVGFYAYFSSYGNGNYDPNDVNIFELDQNLSGPIGLQYAVNFPTYQNTTNPPTAISLSPNPYTTTVTIGTASGTVTYQNPQTFQIFSPGVDGEYGVGGQYVSFNIVVVRQPAGSTPFTRSTPRMPTSAGVKATM